MTRDGPDPMQKFLDRTQQRIDEDLKTREIEKLTETAPLNITVGLELVRITADALLAWSDEDAAPNFAVLFDEVLECAKKGAQVIPVNTSPHFQSDEALERTIRESIEVLHRRTKHDEEARRRHLAALIEFFHETPPAK